MSATPTDLPVQPPVRRIITGHTPEGKARAIVDDKVVSRGSGGSSQFTDLFWSEKFPADNSEEFKDVIKDHVNELVNENGSVFRAVDIPPGGDSPLHRTVSIDYGIVMSGDITCIFDDGKRVVMHPGDVIIQRGTLHAWLNETTEWTRMYFVLLPAEKVKAGDKELDTEFRPLTQA